MVSASHALEEFHRATIRGHVLAGIPKIIRIWRKSLVVETKPPIDIAATKTQPNGEDLRKYGATCDIVEFVIR